MYEGYWWAAAIVLVGSLIALVYVWRLVEAIWFHEPERDISHVKEAPLSMLIPCWILIGASVYFGVTASFTARAAESAAVLLLLGGQ